MNWKLIFQLSAFGLIMAFGTVSLIPEKIEFVFWLVIFSVCAYIIAKVCTRNYFWHGFFLSIFNSIWITAVHLYSFQNYTAHHPDMANMNLGLPPDMATHPRIIILIMAIPFGIMFGVVQGLFAFIASKIVKK
jgi:hypothetical protein